MASPITAHELYRTPEFAALCKRLGVAWYLPTLKLTIEVGLPDELVRITHEYQARPGYREQMEKNSMSETTTAFNEAWRTFMHAPDYVPPEPPTVVTGSK